jgi:hypothetical protein
MIDVDQPVPAIFLTDEPGDWDFVIVNVPRADGRVDQYRVRRERLLFIDQPPDGSRRSTEEDPG